MPSPGSPEPQRAPRLLIVDDHRNTRESMALGLRGRDVEVATAASAEAALAVLAGERFDWMISDVRMPGLSGIDLAEHARRLQPALGMVLMTAYDVSEDERRRIADSGAELVIKPVTADWLVDAYVAAPLARARHGEGT